MSLPVLQSGEAWMTALRTHAPSWRTGAAVLCAVLSAGVRLVKGEASAQAAESRKPPVSPEKGPRRRRLALLGLVFLRHALRLMHNDAAAMPTFGYSIVYLMGIFALLLVDHYIPAMTGLLA